MNAQVHETRVPFGTDPVIDAHNAIYGDSAANKDVKEKPEKKSKPEKKNKPETKSLNQELKDKKIDFGKLSQDIAQYAETDPELKKRQGKIDKDKKENNLQEEIVPKGAISKLGSMLLKPLDAIGYSVWALPLVAVASVGAHTLAVSKIYQHSGKNQEIADYWHDWAESITRYLDSCNFIYNGIKALKDNRVIDAIGKLGTPLLQITKVTPLHNFVLSYGWHSALNYLIDKLMDFAKKRGMIEDTVKFESPSDNIAALGKAFKEYLPAVVQEAKEGKYGKIVEVFSFLAMEGGTLSGLAFARKENSTPMARTTSLFRNAGGFTGDMEFLFGKGHKFYFRIVGFFCGIASVLGQTQRYLDLWGHKVASRILQHIVLCCDQLGFTTWVFGSKFETDAKEKENKKNGIKAEVAESSQNKHPESDKPKLEVGINLKPEPESKKSEELKV